MSIKRLAPAGCLIFASFFVSGCEELALPSFNGGLLNPDIRHLRTAEVMSGVKCAMVSFMAERERRVLQERETYPASSYPFEAQKGTHFEKYTLHSTAKTDAKKYRCELLNHHVENGKCVANSCPASVGVMLWDYEPVGLDRSQPRGCVPIPDYSRFALDQNQSAKLTFNMKATNSGFINYQRIDAKKLGSLQHFIDPGNAAASAPFPQLKFDANQVTTVEVLTVLPQSVHARPVKELLHPAYRYLNVAPIIRHADLAVLNATDDTVLKGSSDELFNLKVAVPLWISQVKTLEDQIKAPQSLPVDKADHSEILRHTDILKPLPSAAVANRTIEDLTQVNKRVISAGPQAGPQTNPQAGPQNPVSQAAAVDASDSKRIWPINSVRSCRSEARSTT
jgi:hypothetical protein